jgi:HK97 gp10 family phage protein
VTIKLKTYGLMDLAEGLRDLEKELVALGANAGRRALTRASRKAFAPVLEAARANAPEDTGLLKKHIVITTQRPKEGASVVNVGLRVVKAKTGAPGSTRPLDYQSPHWRWHFIEFGTSAKAAHPFLRPALDANAETVVGNLRGELRKAIDRVLKKRAKAGALGAMKRGLAPYAKAAAKGFRRGLR